MRAGKMLAATGLALSLGVSVAGCGDRAAEGPPTVAPVVTVASPLVRPVTDFADFTGRTEAVQSVEVRARVFGYLDRVHFADGDEVRKGELLFEIDPRTYQADLEQAQAQLRLAQAQVSFAEVEYARNLRLLERRAGSREDVDKALRSLQVAQAQIGVEQARIAQAQLNLDFTRVSAPIAGRASRHLLTEGNLIQGGQTAATLLTTIVSMDPMYAYFDVDEQTMLRIQERVRAGTFLSARDEALSAVLNTASTVGLPASFGGQAPLFAAASLYPGRKAVLVPVSIGLANEQGYPHRGYVDFVDNQVDTSTGTIRVRGLFGNAERVLTPGLFVRVRLPLGKPRQAVLVSERALGSNQGQKFVYVLNEQNEVVYRPVALGVLRDGLRVVEEGLRPGERVVVNGLQRIRPGVTVDPKPGDMTPAPAAAGAPHGR